MIPAWGRSSNNRGLRSGNSLCRTQDKTTLGSSRDSGDRRGHNSYDCGSGGRRSSGGSRARVGLADRGRRGVAHPRSKAVSSARLHHGWAREGDEGMGWLRVKMKESVCVCVCVGGGGGVGFK